MSQEQDTDSTSVSSSISKQVHSYIAARASIGHVFLSTGDVLVMNDQGFKHNCRVVLDSGSMVNFVSKRILKIIILTTKKTELLVADIGASRVQSVAIVDNKIYSRIKKFLLTLPFYVIPTVINELSSCMMPRGGWSIPQKFISEMTDTKFYEAGVVDLLIGAGTYYEILEAERVPISHYQLAISVYRIRNLDG